MVRLTALVQSVLFLLFLPSSLGVRFFLPASFLFLDLLLLASALEHALAVGVHDGRILARLGLGFLAFTARFVFLFFLQSLGFFFFFFA